MYDSIIEIKSEREREGGSPRSVTSVRGGGHLPENERGRIKLKMELKKKKEIKGERPFQFNCCSFQFFMETFFPVGPWGESRFRFVSKTRRLFYFSPVGVYFYRS